MCWDRRKSFVYVAFASSLMVASFVALGPVLAQGAQSQSGGDGSGGSENPNSRGAGAKQPKGNGSRTSQAAPKPPIAGPLPFIAPFMTNLPGGGSFSVDTRGITLQTADNTAKFRIGGRLQLDGSVADLRPPSLGLALTDNFLIRRAYIESYLTLYDSIEAAFQYDFASTTQPINDAVLAYRGLKNSVFSVGNFKEPFGLNQLESDNITTFAERALTNAFAPARNFGGAIGTYGDKWTATAGVYGGNANTGIEDNGVAGTARVTYAPMLTKDQLLHFGVAGSYRSLDPGRTDFSISSRPENNSFMRNLVSTGTLRNAKDVGRFEFETIYQFGSYRIQGEYAFADVGGVTPTTAMTGRSDRFFQSGYVEGAWVINGNGRPYRIAPNYGSELAVLTGVEIDDSQRISRGGYGVFEVAARYSTIDLQDGATLGGKEDDITAGINWYPDRNIRVVADYVHARANPAASSLKVNGKVESDAFIGRLQFNW